MEPNDWTEKQRQLALEKYAIIDSPPEDAFDDITKIASEVCQTPIALISFVQEMRQWFKAVIGLDSRETPRAEAICASAMLSEDLFMVPDLTHDSRFADNPLVLSGPKLRFYAGASLKTPEGIPLGTLSVLDTRPRPNGLSHDQQTVLSRLATQVMVELELRREAIERTNELCRLQEQFDNAPVLLSVISPRTQKFEYANQGFRALFDGIDLTNKEIGQVLARFPGEPFLESLRETCETGRATHGSHTLFPSNERGRYLKFNHQPSVGETGTVLAVATVAVDITDEHLGLQKAKRLELQLERARQLSTIGVVSATISHELNQPLFAASNYAEVASLLLQANPPDASEAEKMVAAISEQIQRAAELIQRVREFASGRPPQVKATSLKGCVQQVIELMNSFGENVRIKTAFHGRDTILADRIQIEQVLLNLFRNSARALTALGQEPSVEVSTLDVGGDSVEIEVRDHGPGIPPDVLERIFQPFHPSSTEGMGLGLAIVRSIVERHGGQISVANQDGAVFKFTLPLAPPGKTAVQKPQLAA